MFLNQETSIKISRQLRIAAQRCQGILKSQFLSELNDQTFFVQLVIITVLNGLTGAKPIRMLFVPDVLRFLGIAYCRFS